MKTLFDDEIPRCESVMAMLVNGPNDTRGRIGHWYAGEDGTIWFSLSGNTYDYESPGVYRYRESAAGGRVRTGRPFVTLTPDGAIRPSISADADL